jgi:hypothetical protein
VLPPAFQRPTPLRPLLPLLLLPLLLLPLLLLPLPPPPPPRCAQVSEQLLFVCCGALRPTNKTR